nr:hypothetical protein [Tanacetum cinerariifolium]
MTLGTNQMLCNVLERSDKAREAKTEYCMTCRWFTCEIRSQEANNGPMYRTKYKGIDDLTSVKFIYDAVKEKKYLKSLLNTRCKARKVRTNPDYQVFLD